MIETNQVTDLMAYPGENWLTRMSQLPLTSEQVMWEHEAVGDLAVMVDVFGDHNAVMDEVEFWVHNEGEVPYLV